MERTGVSNRDACKIVNACLKDLSFDSPQFILDPAKLRRQRNMWRGKDVVEHAEFTVEIVGIGFDGRTDKTLRLVEQDDGDVNRTTTIKEDHYVICSYPNGDYIDHICPQSGRAMNIVKEIISVLNERKSLASLESILCDGTNVNTAWKNGIIRLLETNIGRPLQWCICLLHLNELPLRAIFTALDGSTSTPNAFKGILGAFSADC
jgi:hypothetical protein